MASVSVRRHESVFTDHSLHVPEADQRVTWLCVAVAALAAVAAGLGVFLTGGEASNVVTAQGATVPLYGRGIYRHDSLTVGSGSVGVDAVTLFLAVPLLTAALVAHRRGSVRGTAALLGALTYFLYLYVSRAVDTAFNELFLLYVATMTASLFALIATLRALPAEAIAAVMDRLPRRSTLAFLIVLPAVLVLVWVPLVVDPLITGQPPAAVEHYTTFVTGTLDLGILLPTALVGASLIRRRQASGYLIAFCLAGFSAILGPALIAMTAAQLHAGVTMGAADIVTFVVSFLALSTFAASVLIASLRRLPDHSLDGVLPPPP